MIEQAVYELLKALAGGRVYALRAPQNVTAPFIVYQRTGTEIWRSANAPSNMAQASIQIDAYAETYTEVKTLAGQIEAILDGYRGPAPYGGGSPQETLRVGGVSLQEQSDLFDQTDAPFLYRVTSSYLFTYDRS